MKIFISIEYKTQWGESLVLCLDGKEIPMTPGDSGIWTAEVSKVSGV